MKRHRDDGSSSQGNGAQQFMDSALKRLRGVFASAPSAVADEVNGGAMDAAGSASSPSRRDRDGFPVPNLPRSQPTKRATVDLTAAATPTAANGTGKAQRPATATASSSPLIENRSRQLSSLRKLKATGALKSSFNDLLRRFSPYEDVQRAGFSSSKRDYLELIQYAQRVITNTQLFHGGRGREPDVPSARPGSAMSISSTLSSGTMMSSSSDLSMLRSSDIQSVSSMAVVRAPPAPVSLREEQQWVKQLRSKIQNLLQINRNITTEEEIKTPAYDQLREESRVIEEKIALQQERQQRQKPNNFPALSDEAVQTVQNALRQKTGVLSSAFNIEIHPHDMETLSGRSWLNDEIINFYMNLIMERSKKNAGRLPDVHAFNTFFYSKVLKDGYSGVKRWTKKFDLFAKHIVLIPVHLGMHWCCAAINFKLKRLEYYDSLHGSNAKVFELLKIYLQQESFTKRNADFDFSGWTELAPKNIPAQENGHDCGVFACMFAEYLSREEPFDFSQAHMKYFRKRMVYEIMSQKLLID